MFTVLGKSFLHQLRMFFWEILQIGLVVFLLKLTYFKADIFLLNFPKFLRSLSLLKLDLADYSMVFMFLWIELRFFRWIFQSSCQNGFLSKCSYFVMIFSLWYCAVFEFSIQINGLSLFVYCFIQFSKVLFCGRLSSWNTFILWWNGDLSHQLEQSLHDYHSIWLFFQSIFQSSFLRLTSSNADILCDVSVLNEDLPHQLEQSLHINLSFYLAIFPTNLPEEFSCWRYFFVKYKYFVKLF